MKLKCYVFNSSAAPGCSFLRVVKAIVVEYKSSGTGVRIHSILHFFMTPNVIYFLNQYFKTISYVCICESTCLDE